MVRILLFLGTAISFFTFPGRFSQPGCALCRFGHTGLIPGYQTMAEYHGSMDGVIVQFTNTDDYRGYNGELSEIVYKRLLKIAKNKP